MNCASCGYNNNINAVFCKKCGANLFKGEKSFVNNINNRINLLAVFLGLAVSLVILFIGSVLYGSLVASGTINLISFAALVLFSTLFIGGIVTGILGNQDDGFINGGFLSLVVLVILGFVIGVLWLIFMGVASSVSNVLHAYTGSLSTGNSISNTSPSNPLDSLSTIIQYVLVLVIAFTGGVLGGGLGGFLKKSFK